MTAWKQLRSGRVVDLCRPDLSDLDIRSEVAVPLARQVRWSGHTIDVDTRLTGFSVAQHCVVGADALLAETDCATTALVFLIHDAHEALIDDVTTPTLEGLEEMVETVLRTTLGEAAARAPRAALGAGLVRTAMRLLKDRLDVEIFRLAGLPEPSRLPQPMRAAVAEMDTRMLDVERRQLMAAMQGRRVEEIWPASVLRARPVRLRGVLTPWRTNQAAAAWLERFEAWRIRPTPVRSARAVRAPATV